MHAYMSYIFLTLLARISTANCILICILICIHMYAPHILCKLLYYLPLST